jgi:hypothetical protein
MNQKTRNIVVVIAVLAIIILLGSGGFFRLDALGSGSGWEYDYQLGLLDVNGEGFSISDDEESTYTQPEVTTSGGGGGGSILFTWDVLSMDQYHIRVDPDGPPESNWATAVHNGLVPNVYVSMSQAWQVDADGNKYTGPSLDERQVGDETWYKYNYAFNIYFITEARQFTAFNQFYQPYQSAESGRVTGYALITVGLQETVFGPIVGEFLTATVLNMETNLDELAHADVVYAIHPDASYTPPNAALDVNNRQYSSDSYTCDITVEYDLQSGLTHTGAFGRDYLPANIWVSYDIVTELLLKEPLEIGDYGGTQTGGLPPTQSMDIPVIIIVVLIIIIVVLVLAFKLFGGPKVHVNTGYSR